MTAAQGSRFVRHAEQGADEILERTGDLDQEIGLILQRQLVRLGARRHEPRMGLDIGVLQPGHEGGIEAGKTLAVVEIVEAQAVAERKRSHCRNIRMRRRVNCSYANRLAKPIAERKARVVRDINA